MIITIFKERSKRSKTDNPKIRRRNVYTETQMQARKKRIDKLVDFVIQKIPDHADYLIEEVGNAPDSLGMIAQNFVLKLGSELYGHDLDPVKTAIWNLYIRKGGFLDPNHRNEPLSPNGPIIIADSIHLGTLHQGGDTWWLARIPHDLFLILVDRKKDVHFYLLVLTKEEVKNQFPRLGELIDN